MHRFFFRFSVYYYRKTTILTFEKQNTPSHAFRFPYRPDNVDRRISLPLAVRVIFLFLKLLIFDFSAQFACNSVNFFLKTHYSYPLFICIPFRSNYYSIYGKYGSDYKGCASFFFTCDRNIIFLHEFFVCRSDSCK